MTSFQWECPDCENITSGSEPEKFCRRCGEGNVIRNLTAEEAETDYELQLEDQVNEREADYNRSQFGRLGQ